MKRAPKQLPEICHSADLLVILRIQSLQRFEGQIPEGKAWAHGWSRRRLLYGTGSRAEQLGLAVGIVPSGLPASGSLVGLEVPHPGIAMPITLQSILVKKKLSIVPSV